MNIYEFAVEFEREHREYYLERSKKAPTEHMKKLFEEMAEEERKHEEIVLQLRAEKGGRGKSSQILRKGPGIFSGR